MRTAHSRLVGLAAISLAAAFAAGAPAADARTLPSARDHWKIWCGDGSIIPDFIGSYGDALKQCAGAGGVRRALDLGLAASNRAAAQRVRSGRATGGLRAMEEDAGGNPQGRVVPSARDHWKIQCRDGSIIADFNGSYGQALQQCVHQGGVARVWDLGLIASGYSPPFKAQVPRHDIEAAAPGRAPIVRGEVTTAKGWDGKIQGMAMAPDGFCATATCYGPSLARPYTVVYMGTLNPDQNWFDCRSVGLNNQPKSSDHVFGAANSHSAGSCPVGVKPQELGAAEAQSPAALEAR